MIRGEVQRKISMIFEVKVSLKSLLKAVKDSILSLLFMVFQGIKQ